MDLIASRMTGECPPGISQATWDARPDTWIADLWFYDPTTRVMVRRRSRAAAWTVDRHVSPRKARKHLEAAIRAMAAWCVQNGVSVADADRLLDWYRDRDPDGR